MDDHDLSAYFALGEGEEIEDVDQTTDETGSELNLVTVTDGLVDSSDDFDFEVDDPDDVVGITYEEDDPVEEEVDGPADLEDGFVPVSAYDWDENGNFINLDDPDLNSDLDEPDDDYDDSSFVVDDGGYDEDGA